MDKIFVHFCVSHQCILNMDKLHRWIYEHSSDCDLSTQFCPFLASKQVMPRYGHLIAMNICTYYVNCKIIHSACTYTQIKKCISKMDKTVNPINVHFVILKNGHFFVHILNYLCKQNVYDSAGRSVAERWDCIERRTRVKADWIEQEIAKEYIFYNNIN